MVAMTMCACMWQLLSLSAKPCMHAAPVIAGGRLKEPSQLLLLPRAAPTGERPAGMGESAESDKAKRLLGCNKDACTDFSKSC